MENGENGSADEEMPSQSRRQYIPVVSHDRAVIQMSSMEPGSSPEISSKKIAVATQVDSVANARDGSHTHGESSRPQKESKLELFGFDSLVNILGLKSMTGEQIPPPSNPNDGEDVSITLGRPKDCGYGWHWRVTIAGFILWRLYIFNRNIIKCNCN